VDYEEVAPESSGGGSCETAFWLLAFGRVGVLLYFRLYFLSPQDGRFLRFTEFEAPDDAAAVALAEAHRDGGPMELWCRQRKVRAFDGTGMAAGPVSRRADRMSASLAFAGGGFDRETGA
jgi:hypothetical protein